MKRLLNYLTVIMLVITVMGILNISKVSAEDGSELKTESSVAELSQDGSKKYYDKLDKAIDDAKDGDTITLLKSVGLSSGISSGLEEVSINKSITISLGVYTIGKTVSIKDGANVTITAEKTDEARGGLNSNIRKKSALVIEKGTVTLDTVKVYDPWSVQDEDYFPMIRVGTKGKSDEAKLIIKGDSYLYSYSVAIQTEGSNSAVEIENLELMQALNYGIAITGENNRVDVKNCVEMRGHDAAISAHNGSKGAVINISGGNIYSPIWVYGNNPSCNITGGTIDVPSGYAIEVGGNGSNLTIDEGTVRGCYAGIFGYRGAENTNITINGGKVEGYYSDRFGYSQRPAGIVLQKVGNLTVNGGTIEGYFGIVAYQGNVNINGGTVNGVESGEDAGVIGGDDNNKYKVGTSVVIDNTSSTYSEPAKATIKGGEFSATAETTLFSKGGTTSDYSVSGGIYDKSFNDGFVVPGELELDISQEGEKLWYVGNDARKAVENNKNNLEVEIEVLQGNLTIENAEEGLKVTNNGDGKVITNGQTVAKGETVESPKQPDPVEPEPEVKPDENNQANNPNGSNSVNNPKTGDKVITYIALLFISAFGIIAVIDLKQVNNSKKINK